MKKILFYGIFHHLTFCVQFNFLRVLAAYQVCAHKDAQLTKYLCFGFIHIICRTFYKNLTDKQQTSDIPSRTLMSKVWCSLIVLCHTNVNPYLRPSDVLLATYIDIHCRINKLVRQLAPILHKYCATTVPFLYPIYM